MSWLLSISTGQADPATHRKGTAGNQRIQKDGDHIEPFPAGSKVQATQDDMCPTKTTGPKVWYL